MITKYLLMVLLANGAWLPVAALGNPYDSLRACTAAQVRFERASGGVGRYTCRPIKVFVDDFKNTP